MRSIALAILALAATIPAQSLRLSPVADATTDSSQPTTNLGSDPELSFGKVSNSPAVLLRGYLMFDVAPIVATGRVPVRATLNWFQSRSTAAGCLDVTLHRVTGSWSESTIAWQNQPSHDPTVLARACVGSSFANGWKTFDVTGLVQSWVIGGTNDGVVIRDPSESTAGAARPGFGHSRENGDPNLTPYVSVEFANVFGNGCSARGAVPDLDLELGQPRIGAWLTLRTANVVSGSLPGMIFGASNVTWNGQPLPLALTGFGLPGCDLLVAPDIIGTLLPVAANEWRLTFAWPNDPSLIDQDLYIQSVLGPPTGGIELSNGIGFTMRQ